MINTASYKQVILQKGTILAKGVFPLSSFNPNLQ